MAKLVLLTDTEKKVKPYSISILFDDSSIINLTPDLSAKEAFRFYRYYRDNINVNLDRFIGEQIEHPYTIEQVREYLGVKWLI